jgi:hypothetical protein
MRKVASFVLILTALALTGCGDSHDAVMSDMVASMEKFNSILDGVKDEASAKAAKSKLEALTKEMKVLTERSKKLPKATAEELKSMQDKHEKEFVAVSGKIQKNMFRIATNPTAMSALGDAMDAIAKSEPNFGN